ncbi:MAG: GGDEF domain-containing protein [Rhizobiaceae bacterium]|nr:GGDEF domain-containing protein [Rhizobiaceae bacterium]
MRLNKAELIVLVLLVALLCAAGFVFEWHRHLASDPTTVAAVPVVPDAYVLWLYRGAMWCLGLAAFVAACLLLPIVREQQREQGKLHILADVLRRRSKEMERAALTDPMTGLFNRRYFDEALGQFLTEFGRRGRPVGLLILDLDHFKRINDTYGHDVGDDVLKAVAGCLTAFTRLHDVVSRLGGEEFAVVVPDMAADDLTAFADRLRLAVERLAIDVGNVRVRITVSIGLALAEPGEATASLYKRADVALYLAKEAGRNRICA